MRGEALVSMAHLAGILREHGEPNAAVRLYRVLLDALAKLPGSDDPEALAIAKDLDLAEKAARSRSQ